MTDENEIDTPKRPWIYNPVLSYTDNGRVVINDMIVNNGLSTMLGLSDVSRHSGVDALRTLLTRFTRDSWAVEVKCSENSIVVIESRREVPAIYSEFRIPYSMTVNEVSSNQDLIILDCVENNDRICSMKVFIKKKYIETLVLRPTPVMHRGEIIDIGTVTVTPYDDQTNAFFVDFDLADTRLLDRIAGYRSNYRFGGTWKELNITSFKRLEHPNCASKTYLFKDPQGLAMAVFDSEFSSREPLNYAKVTEVDRVRPVQVDEYGYMIRLVNNSPQCSPVRSFLNALEDFKDSGQTED